MSQETLSVLPVGNVSLTGAFFAKVETFSSSQVSDTISCSLPDAGTYEESGWRFNYHTRKVEDQPDALDVFLKVERTESNPAEAVVHLCLNLAGCSKKDYVLLPGAVYDGNRFAVYPMSYPPLLLNATKEQRATPGITDVPSLQNNVEPSRLEQMTRDLSIPGIGIHLSEEKTNTWMLTPHATSLGDSSLSVMEYSSPSRRRLTVSAPGFRHNRRYIHCGRWDPSDDLPATFSFGDNVTIHVRLFSEKNVGICDLFRKLTSIRKQLLPPSVTIHSIPFSKAWTILEDKHQRENWYEPPGYLSPIVRETPTPWTWRIGWCGGAMNTLPLLGIGDQGSQEHVTRTLDFIAREGQSPFGFFFDYHDGQQGRGGLLRHDNSTNWHFIRRSCDALYFITKQCLLLNRRGHEVPKAWFGAMKRCSDALLATWNRYEDFGQWLDLETGDMLIPGSQAGAMAPGALAMAGEYLRQNEYLQVARDSAEKMYRNSIRYGRTLGGPGEILQCPDSESAFSLLESFVVLYESTGETKWREYAISAAHQAMSWCVPYDYPFPAESALGRANIHSAGAVIANVQNKHGSPGICTFSGDSLLKLYRATGNELFLEQLQQTAHNLVQYLSRSDRPIGDMPPGWINERVNLSDWCEGIGEIFHGSCWCETACMLTILEIPGLYIRTDTNRCWAFDHIQAEIVRCDDHAMTVRIINPTKWDSRLQIRMDDEKTVSQPLGPLHWLDTHTIFLAADSESMITIDKDQLRICNADGKD